MDSAAARPESARLETELRRDLATGERIMWQAMPDPKRLRAGFGMWIFAIPWTCFSLVWTGIAFTAYLSSFGQPGTLGAAWWGWVFPMFGTPFIAVGCWMLWQPFKAQADAAHTLHAMTDQRLITLTHRKQREVKSVELSKLGPIKVTEKADGWGSLTVETGSYVDSDGDRRTEHFQIVGVPHVARLHRLLIDARAR